MTSEDVLLQVEDLRTHFFSREGTTKAVDGISFVVRRGETLGLAGESGCGKSVASLSVMRLVQDPGRIVSGRVCYNLDGKMIDLTSLDPDGEQIRAIRGKEIAMVFQEPMASFSPVLTVGAQIMEAIILHQQLSKKRARAKTIELLRQVGMPKPEQTIDAYPFEISGGMRQRAMIAMALSCRPALLIADEPTTAVDVTIQAQVLDLIKQLQRESHMAIIMITHDLAVIAQMADTVIIMYLGKAVECASVAEIYKKPLHPYTQALLASAPKLGRGSAQNLNLIKGSVPHPYERPKGCAFHPRCPHRIAGLCNTQEPPMFHAGKDHTVSCYLYDNDEVADGS